MQERSFGHKRQGGVNGDEIRAMRKGNNERLDNTWYQFKVFPLDTKIKGNPNVEQCIDSRTSWQRPGYDYDWDHQCRLMKYYGREEYRKVNTIRQMASCEEKYFLIPHLSKKYLLHWPEGERVTQGPMNFGVGLKTAAESGESISLQECHLCECITFLHHKEHLKECVEYQNQCERV